MNELIQIIFGEYSIIQLFGFAWFFFIGYVIYSLNETSDRNVNSISTPKKWSWKFWINDNWRRYLASFLATYVLFRFYIEIQGHPFTNLEALILGILGDGIGAYAKNKISVLKADRNKIVEKINQDNNNKNEIEYFK
jgi:hypothetical protein